MMDNNEAKLLDLTFTQLFDEVCTFYDTFDAPQDIEAAARKLTEETTEAVIAATKVDVLPDDLYEYKNDLLHELGDVLYCVFGLVRAANFNANDLQAMVIATIEKNRAKTRNTHELDNRGTIVRKREM
jgi:phosphoribosyl-ATP pyrophosphohydrolase